MQICWNFIIGAIEKINAFKWEGALILQRHTNFIVVVGIEALRCLNLCSDVQFLGMNVIRNRRVDTKVVYTFIFHDVPAITTCFRAITTPTEVEVILVVSGTISIDDDSMTFVIGIITGIDYGAFLNQIVVG